MTVYAKIYNVMADLGWISKDSEVSIGGKKAYDYVSEAQFIAEIRPLMIKHKLIVVPIDVSELSVETKTDNNKVSFLTSVVMKYRFVDVESSDFVDVAMGGQGSDSNDKGLYKALTGAYKYLLRESFSVGTGEDAEKTDDTGIVVSTPKVINPIDNVKLLYKSAKLDFDDALVRQAFNDAKIDLNNVTMGQAKEMARIAQDFSKGMSIEDAVNSFRSKF